MLTLVSSVAARNTQVILALIVNGLLLFIIQPKGKRFELTLLTTVRASAVKPRILTSCYTNKKINQTAISKR